MKFLTSRRLANALLLIFCIYFSIAMLWSELKLFDSPLLVILVLIFFVNLSACTIEQILRKPKGARWGLIILHVGLVLFVMGYGYYHFGYASGYKYLGVNQSTKLNSKEISFWQGGFLNKDWDGNASITLNDVKITNNPKEVRFHWATLSFQDKNGISGTENVTYSKPLKIEEAKITVLERGFSPIVNWNGQTIYWSILTHRQKDKDVYRDNLKGSNTKVEGEYFPGGPDGKNGKLQLTFNGKKHLLSIGDTIDINGEKFTWLDTGFWVQIGVTVEPGIYLIGLSSILIILGSTIYYIPQLWKREKHVI